MEASKKADGHTLWTLFKTCFIISACTFGGGMVIISMLQKKFVEELKWIGQEEVMDLVAIAQSCPGVMAVNTSIIIGYRIAGVTGVQTCALPIYRVGDHSAAHDHSDHCFRLLCAVSAEPHHCPSFKRNAGRSGGSDDQRDNHNDKKCDKG